MKSIFSYIINFILLSLVVICLNACASFYTEETTNAPPYLRPVKVDNDFDISGRFSIKNATHNKYGNFNWIKIDKNEELSFNTPLGQTVAKIVLNNGIATLTTEDRTYTSTDLDSMMQQKLGFILPLAYLHYWVQGVALPDVPDTSPLFDGFKQLGWNIEYLKWHDANHPQIIQLTKEQLVIKLLID